jgi:hypothetical protein
MRLDGRLLPREEQDSFETLSGNDLNEHAVLSQRMSCDHQFQAANGLVCALQCCHVLWVLLALVTVVHRCRSVMV